MYSFQTNVGSLNALEQARQNSLVLAKTTRNLSSGLRINTGADDPSGLGITSLMRAHIGGVQVAMANIQDDISMIHTADGKLAEMHDILMRIKDLAVRGANQAPFTNRDHDKINDEIKTLANEIARIINTADFNANNQAILDLLKG